MQMPNQHHMSSEQEPQSPMPGPELLNEAAKRPPMRLKDFEDLATANNPTLKQANDLVQALGSTGSPSGALSQSLGGIRGK